MGLTRLWSRWEARIKARVWPLLTKSLPGQSFVSYSQWGEDAVLYRLLERAPKGFYVDVGAFHPVISSNTYALYVSGWNGLTIEANPDAQEKFGIYRPRDNHLCCAITDNAEASAVPYFQFADPVFNTIDKKQAEMYVARGVALVKQSEIPGRTIASVLDEYVTVPRIDLLSIDIEGLDEAVLRSWPWQRFRPRFLVVEVQAPDQSFGALEASELGQMLQRKGYALITRCGLSTIWGHQWRLSWLGSPLSPT